MPNRTIADTKSSSIGSLALKFIDIAWVIVGLAGALALVGVEHSDHAALAPRGLFASLAMSCFVSTPIATLVALYRPQSKAARAVALSFLWCLIALCMVYVFAVLYVVSGGLGDVMLLFVLLCFANIRSLRKPPPTQS